MKSQENFDIMRIAQKGSTDLPRKKYHAESKQYCARMK